MADFVIVTDATSDLTPALVEELGVIVLPMPFTVDGKDYFNYPDSREMDPHVFYDLLRAEKQSTTAQLTTAVFIDAFSPFLEEGKDVLYMAFSSALSGTYDSSRMAAEELRGKYPDRKILPVDTKAASMGQALMVYYAAQQKKAGKTIDETASYVEENRLKIAHWFTVDDLNHLKRGGRVSSAAALFGSLLGIKPVLHVDDEGRLIPMSKVRGRENALKALVDRMEETALNPKTDMVFISHGDDPAAAARVEQMVKDRLGVPTVITGPIGPVIGSHSGPGTVALFFLASRR